MNFFGTSLNPEIIGCLAEKLNKDDAKNREKYRALYLKFSTSGEYHVSLANFKYPHIMEKAFKISDTLFSNRDESYRKDIAMMWLGEPHHLQEEEMFHQLTSNKIELSTFLTKLKKQRCTTTHNMAQYFKIKEANYLDIEIGKVIPTKTADNISEKIVLLIFGKKSKKHTELLSNALKGNTPNKNTLDPAELIIEKLSNAARFISKTNLVSITSNGDISSTNKAYLSNGISLKLAISELQSLKNVTDKQVIDVVNNRLTLETTTQQILEIKDLQKLKEKGQLPNFNNPTTALSDQKNCIKILGKVLGLNKEQANTLAHCAIVFKNKMEESSKKAEVIKKFHKADDSKGRSI